MSERSSKSALNCEFNNLSEFLPSQHDPSSDMETYVDSNNSIQVRPKKLKRSLDSFANWLSAWNNYEELLMSKKPELYSYLSAYRSFIHNCDKKYLWHAIYAYDCRHRAKLASSHSWEFHHVDNDLYITIFDASTVKRSAKQCFRCKSLDHPVQECPFPAPNSMEENKKKPSSKGSRYKWIHQGKEGCNNYQYGRCTETSCPRAHVCRSCRGPEPFHRCSSCS